MNKPPTASRFRLLRVLIVGIVGGVAVAAAVTMSRKPEPDQSPTPPPVADGPVQQLFKQVTEAERNVKANPKDAKLQYELGMAYGPARRYHDAAAAFERAIQAGMDTAGVHYHLGSCYLHLNRQVLCIAEYSKAIERDPDNVIHYLALAEACDEFGQTDKAIAALDRAAKRMRTLVERSCCAEHDTSNKKSEQKDQNAAHAETLGKLASEYGAFGYWNKALPFAQQAVKLDSHSAPAHSLLGACYFHTGQFREALPHLRAAATAEAIPDTHYLLGIALMRVSPEKAAQEEAYRALEKAIIKSPTMARAWFELGNLCAQRKEWDKSAKAYVRAYNYGYEAVNSMKRASEMFEKAGDREAAQYFRGMYLQNQSRFEEAQRCFDSLLKSSDPQRRLLAYTHKADVLHRVGRDEDAVKLLKEAIRKERDQPREMQADLYRLLADAYQEVKNLDGRIRALKQIAALVPDRSDGAYRELALLYVSDSRYDEAERWLRECMRLKPDKTEYYYLLAKVFYTRSHEQGRLSACIELLERCVAMDPFYTKAYMLLGRAYQRAKQWQRAADALKHVIDHEPGRGEAYLELGKCYQRLGKTGASKEMFSMYNDFRRWKTQLDLLETKAKERPKDADAQFALASAYLEAQDYFNAMDRFQRVVLLNPNHAQARRALAQIYDTLARPEDARRERKIAAKLAQGK